MPNLFSPLTLLYIYSTYTSLQSWDGTMQMPGNALLGLPFDRRLRFFCHAPHRIVLYRTVRYPHRLNHASFFVFFSRYVMVHTASFWAKSFMHEFREVCDGQRESTRKLPTLPIKDVRGHCTSIQQVGVRGVTRVTVREGRKEGVVVCSNFVARERHNYARCHGAPCVSVRWIVDCEHVFVPCLPCYVVYIAA